MVQPQTFAYLRVSTSEQGLKKNKADILHLANEKGLGQVRWVEETVSGRVSWRKQTIANVIQDLQTGDNLLVSELSRLGRSIWECMGILSVISRHGIHTYAVKGNWELDDSNQSKIMAMPFALAVEIERNLISHCTKETLAAKKRAGVNLGRPKGVDMSKLDKHRPEIESLLAQGSTQKHIAGRFDTTEANLSRWLKKHGLRRK